MFGGFRAEGKTGWQLTPPTLLRESPEGKLEMLGKYDPPGSGWLAVGASIVTFIVVFAIAQFTGFMAGPGWLVWYYIIRATRREDVTMDLTNAEDVLLDDNKKRMAIRTEFNGRSKWMIFGVNQDYEGEAALVRSTYGTRVREGIIEDPSKVFFFVLLGFVLTIIAVVVAMIAIGVSQS
jgi:hypothetical protein